MSAENSTFLKGIHKLEAIGKKGKLSKIIKLSIEHFEHLKNTLDDFSLKILAYIIKGFFLTLKKSYENFNKDLECFIEANIKGVNWNVKKKEKEKSEEKELHSDIFSMQNLSFFSENTQFEKFMNDTNMTDKINKTLKAINKKFSHADFSLMSEDKKKEYLKKNFIQPLSESLPMSSEYFANSSLEQCISVNENFANYIQFDLKTITNEMMPQGMNDDYAYENTGNNLDFDFEKIVLGNKFIVKNPNLRSDNRIELKLDNLNNTLDEADSYKTYYKHYKKVVIFDHLQKFKKGLNPYVKELPLYTDLISTDFDNLENMQDEGQFRAIIEGTPIATSGKSTKVMERLLSTTSMKNIFENGMEFFSGFSNLAPDSNEEHAQEIDFGDNLRLETIAREERETKEMRKFNEEENMRQVNMEIQRLLENQIDIKKNFEEFKLDNLTKEIQKGTDFRLNSSFRAKCSLIFYNLMNVSQTKQLSLRQNQPFDKLYLVKI